MNILQRAGRGAANAPHLRSVLAPTLAAEDALDRFVVQRIEGSTKNRFLKIIARMVFNPTRSSANLLRFEKPWRRDR